MRKMLIDLFFPDSDRLGEFPGAHLVFAQEGGHLLTDSLHVIPYPGLSELKCKLPEVKIPFQ